MTRLKTAVLLMACATMAPLGAAQADYPNKPVRLVIPFGAGGGDDGLARVVQTVAREQGILPKPLVVANVTGAGGAVGARQVKNARPDGYTLLQIHEEMFAASAIGRLDFTPLDFEPVAQLSQTCTVLVVPKDFERQDLPGVLAYARENPGKLNQADDIGGATYFASLKLMQQAGTEWSIVPVGATAQRFASLKGGFTNLALMSPLWVKRAADDLHPVAYLGAERHPLMPEVPTAKELGYDVTACLTRRVWAPKGTPQATVDYLATAFEQSLQTPEVGDYLKKNGENAVPLKGEALAARVRAEYEEFQTLAKMAKSNPAAQEK